MAKVKLDTTKFPGFDTLPDDVKNLLLSYEAEVPDPDLSGYVTKKIFDEKASEAAKLSKQLKEKMTEAEKQENERLEREQAREKAYNDLLTENNISKTTARYLALGYDQKLAEESAKAFVEGNHEAVFANQQKFIENQKKAWDAERLKNMTPPPSGSGSDGGTQMSNGEALAKQIVDQRAESNKAAEASLAYYK